MKVLLVIQEKEIRDLVAFHLETDFNAETFAFSTYSEVVDPLRKQRQKFDLAICCSPANVAGFFGLLNMSEVQIPTILFPIGQPKGKKAFADPQIIGIVNPRDPVDSVKALVQDFLINNKAVEGEAPAGREYCRIRTELLARVGTLKSDIYIRLSDVKVLKIFSAGDEFNEEDRKKYLEEKKLEYFYLKTTEIDEFVRLFRKELSRLMTDKMKAEESEKISPIIFDTVQQLIVSIGATPEVKETVKQAVEVAVQSIKSSVRLNQILSRVGTDRDKYIPAHSAALSELAVAMALPMGWSSDSTLQKLCLAALLHDVTLDNHVLASISTIDDLQERQNEFTVEELKAYRLHPIHAAQLCRKFEEVAPEVDIIVEQHHEKCDGKGFPKGLNAQRISPLASVFIIAHDLLDEIFKADGKINISQFIEERKDIYSFGNFKKILSNLKDFQV